MGRVHDLKCVLGFLQLLDVNLHVTSVYNKFIVQSIYFYFLRCVRNMYGICFWNVFAYLEL